LERQHDLARRLLPEGCGGVLAFELAGGREAGRTFTEALQVALLAPSLGDVKTLAMHPASTSHAAVPPEDLAAAGVTEGLVRVAVGIEHPEDLWQDFTRALDKV
ncbi:PLP-dependent transferase, partial [Actinomadura kijaniata]|uniref:PLP-dependent transferase n=1 Tax=Actinomadura kijaniata TaxID=46161 RepID=UPI003F19D246